MSGWVDLHFFSYLSYIPLYRVSLLAYNFFEGCQAEWTSNFFFYLTCLPLYQISLFTYYFFRRMSSWVDLKNCFFCISFSWFQIGVLTLTSGRGHPLEYLPTIFSVSRLIDLKSGFGRRMQLLPQVYCSGSTRSVFIQRLWFNIFNDVCALNKVNYLLTPE